MRQGVKNVFPAQADKREALFLPLYFMHPSFAAPISKTDHLASLAAEVGFFGMLRPHIFSMFGPHFIVFVLKGNQ